MNKLELQTFKFFFDAFLPASDEDYYNVLGVSSHASPKDIHRAYIEKARSLHPEKDNPSSCTNVEECSRLYTAYEVRCKLNQ
jgi:DnaJ-class molecular chaperone